MIKRYNDYQKYKRRLDHQRKLREKYGEMDSDEERDNAKKAS
jgi:hypothetical protein